MATKTKGKRRVKEINIDPVLCKGCELCINYCPTSVLARGNVISDWGGYVPMVKDLEACIVCRLCEEHCPDFAIVVIEDVE